MKKIAFVSDSIYPYNKGGKEKRLFDISTRLSQKGHDVHIYTMKWWRGKNVRTEKGVTLHAISPYYSLYSGNRRSIKQGVMFGLACLKLINEDWDIVDVDHMPFFPLFSVKFICVLKSKKMYATWHEVWGSNYWMKYMGIKGLVSAFIERFSVLLPDEIISVSNLTTTKLKGRLKSNKKIYTIPVGIDFEYIKAIRMSSKKFDVVFAGRLLSHKNVDVLIKSVFNLKRQFPRIKCLIIGDGPEKKRLEKLVSDLKLKQNVLFSGFIENHSKVYSLIKSSRVFVLPSTREGFGIVVIEANACGIPVITINHKDNASKSLIMNNQNGITCDLDPNVLAEKISIIFRRSANKEEKVKYESFARVYQWENIINKLEKIYMTAKRFEYEEVLA
ncbi:MAG TPA: glycosyltransferase family 4 protein [Patescibacteria group bacterium]|nr:glycosyltransferase family 4 protein [Patescibacteria group bacterium]